MARLKVKYTEGVKVTLRGDKMWEFLDRLFNVALPRVRDFRGINPNAFDGRGNYAMGLKEQLIFPEIEYDKVDKIRGMDICICTTATTDEERRQAGNFSFPRACANTHPCVIQMENRHQKSGEHGAACGSHSSDTLTS